MNSVTDNQQDAVNVAVVSDDTDADVIELLRRFHYGEPAAAARTRGSDSCSRGSIRSHASAEFSSVRARTASARTSAPRRHPLRSVSRERGLPGPSIVATST